MAENVRMPASSALSAPGGRRRRAEPSMPERCRNAVVDRTRRRPSLDRNHGTSLPENATSWTVHSTRSGVDATRWKSLQYMSSRSS